MSSNGVVFQNGSGGAMNGDGSFLVENGCEENGDTGAVGRKQSSGGGGGPVRRRKQRQIGGMDADIIRLIGQHLREMGLEATSKHLMEESGCALDHPKAAKFRTHVIAGEWDQANKSLEGLVPLLEDPCNVEKMRLLLLREKYLELLEAGRELEALYTLRHELAPLPLHHSDKDIQVLSSYMMYPDKEKLRQAANWLGVKGGARERLMDKLQAFLPASVMLPPKRLRQLLTQAVQMQVERCPFHYVEHDVSDYSLLTDHICSRAQFPSETVVSLTDHSDEVWHLRFSHDGTKLASGSRDGQVIIWSFNKDHQQPHKEYTLKGQGDGIAFLTWSPDDSLLLTCGREDNPEAIVFSSQTGEVKCRVSNSAEDSLTCSAWHSDGTKFYVGGTRGQFFECSLDGSVTASWEGIRVHAMATHPHSNLVYAADTHNRIRQYNFQDKTSNTILQESHPIMSFTLSRNGRLALLNVATQGVHVWDLQDRCLLRRYQGVTQGLYTIHSCYGGFSDSFIASGSEDHHVYIWHHRRESPVIVLRGHSRAVNCVSWNPTHHHMLASASDDGTVRIWGTEEQMKAQLQYQREREKEKEEQRQQDDSVQQDTSLQATLNGASSSTRQGQGFEVSESEGMDTQPSEASQSSETDPQSSELERNEESTSSLSLSSERLEEGILGNIVLPMGSAPSLSSGAALRTGVSLQLRSASLETLQRSSYSLQITNTRQQSEGSEAGSVASATAAQGATGSTNVTLVPISIASSLQHLGSSVDQDSSQLSLDSSNGSTSQGDISQLDADFEEGLHFSARSTTRTSADSNASAGETTTESSSGSMLVSIQSTTTQPSSSSSSQQSTGTSVIVQSGGRSPPQQRRTPSTSDDGSSRQQQPQPQEGSRQQQQQQREGEEEGGSRRTGGSISTVV